MNTRQTSVKTGHLESTRQTPEYHSGSHQTDQKGKFKRTNTDLPNTYRRSQLWKLPKHPIVQDILLIYPHFGIEFFQLPRFLNWEDSEDVTLDPFLSSLLNIVQTSDGQCTSNKKYIPSKTTLSVTISQRLFAAFNFCL